MNIFKVNLFIIIAYNLIYSDGAIKLQQNRRRLSKSKFITTSTQEPTKTWNEGSKFSGSSVNQIPTSEKPIVDSATNPKQPTRIPMIHFKHDSSPTSAGKKSKSRKPTFEYKLQKNQSTTDSDETLGGKGRKKMTKKPERKKPLNIGIILPKSTFHKRNYEREIKIGLQNIRKRNKIGSHHWLNLNLQMRNVVIIYLKPSSSPMTILGTLCDKLLSKNVTTILYLFNMELYGRATASVQYFFQLTGYLGIPVISWNADNSGLERDQRSSGLQLQLAPSIEHQIHAMLSILDRYSWPRFAVVTTQIAGHTDFIQSVRDIIAHKSQLGQQFILMDTLIVSNPAEDIKLMVSTEARILFLYATRAEAAEVLAAASKVGLTGENYLWIVTQSVITSIAESPKEFPVGMLGVHFGTSPVDMIEEIQAAISVFGAGVQDYYEEENTSGEVLPSLSPNLSCISGNSKWNDGINFYRFLKDVKVDIGTNRKKPVVEFNQDGTRKYIELKIMNLRPDMTKKKVWEEIGVWHSNSEKGLQVKDVIWPGHSHVPPPGVPEKFHLRVTFIEEPPFIHMAPPHPKTGSCTANKGVLCRIATDQMMVGVNVSWAMMNPDYYRCCSGFCVDLLVQFSIDLGFSFEFVRVEDGLWGSIVNRKWTGLPLAIINGKADMIMSSIKISSQRKEVLDFTVPFLDTGVTILVTKRTGIISPTAFLEPFDTASWLLVGAVAIQVAAISIFLFEWLSPAGYNMKFHPPAGQRFSLLRTLWLVWAILFQAAVNIDVPRSVTGRVMGNVWAMFALIFLAIYTANLAAFMITREEFYDLSGIEDKRIQNPSSMKPPFRFGTTSLGHTDLLVKKAFPEMWSYMKQFNQSSPVAGVKAVKKGRLDAFLYDATVLEYLSGQDDECRLLTVGSWYALTGYGVAFRRNSKYISMFNEQIMMYRENGYLERLSRFWFTGACGSDSQYSSSSEPLALEQFMSTFFLLGCGVVLGVTLLTVEHLYFKYFRFYLAKWKCHDFCTLISMSMGHSLRFKNKSMSKLRTLIMTLPCKNPMCDMQVWKAKHKLDLANLRVFYLEQQLVENGVWKRPKGGKRVIYRQSNDENSMVESFIEPLPSWKRYSSTCNVSSHRDNKAAFERRFSERSRKRTDRWNLDFDPQPWNSYRRSSSSVPPNTFRRRDLTDDYVTSTELIRKPLIDKRGFDFDTDDVETVL